MENYELECLMEEEKMRDANHLIKTLLFGLETGKSLRTSMEYVINTAEWRGCEEEFRKELLRRLK